MAAFLRELPWFHRNPTGEKEETPTALIDRKYGNRNRHLDFFCGIGAAVVAQSRGANGCLWFGVGALFGPFGLAFAFASGTGPACSFNNGCGTVFELTL